VACHCPSVVICVHPWFRTQTQQIIRLRWNFALPVVIDPHHPWSSVSIRGSKHKRSRQSSGGRGSCQAANLFRLRWNFALPVHSRPPSRSPPSVLICVHPWFQTQTQQTIFGRARLLPSRKSVSAQVELRPPYRDRSPHPCSQDAAQGGAAVVRVGRVLRPFNRTPSQVWRTRAS
jgi:hypothetical protein